MKKIMILALAVCFAGAAANAQDVYKQTGGEKNIEVLFAPFGSSPIGINGIKYRKFTSASEAWRAEVFLGFNSSTSINGTATNGDELRDRSSSFDIQLTGGKEWHLPGTDRLSPYYGAIATLGLNSSRDRSEIEFGANNDIEESTISNGNFSVGAAAVGGFDYYFAHNIYLGAEIGFGVNFISEFDQVQSSTIENSEDITTPQGGAFNVGPIAQARLRLGILF